MNLCPKGRDATCVHTPRIEKAGKCAINARGMSVKNILFQSKSVSRVLSY